MPFSDNEIPVQNNNAEVVEKLGDVIAYSQATATNTQNLGDMEDTLSSIDGHASEIETSVETIDDTVATTGSAITAKGIAVAGTDGTNARILKTDSSGELQIDVLSIAAGNNNIGDVDVASIAAGDNNIGNVDAIQSGTWIVTKSSVRETPVASASRSTSSNSGTLAGDYGPYAEIIAQLKVTAHSGTNPTLDVIIEHSVDGGTTWTTADSFAQVTTADSATYLTISRWNFTGPVFFGNKLRVSWTIGGTDTPTYTFAVDWVCKS